MRTTVLFFGLIISIISNKAQAQSNYAVNYDGSDDYISLPPGVAISQSNTFTVEAWVYWTGAGNGCIYSETVQGNDNPMFSISPRSGDGGGIELVLRDNSTTGLVLQPAIATITANRWVHVAVVRTSATNIKIYIDGVLKDNQTFTAPAAWTPTRVNIGIRERVSQDGPFAGKIEELKIWNTARTAAEIKRYMLNKNLASNTSGLVAWYRFNEGSGTTAANSCTNTSSVNGTLTNGPTWVSSPIRFGGNALHFDQVDDKVLAPVPSTATTNITLEAWVYHNGGTGTDHVIMTNGVVGTNGYVLYVLTNHNLFIRLGGSSFNTGVGLSANTWTHLALVIGTTGFTLYKNGTSIYSNTGTPPTPTGNFILGINNNGTQPFDGSIDEVRLWTTARTQTEIQNNMNFEIDPSTAGLALYYTFDQGIASGANAGLTTLIDQTGNNNGTLTNFGLSSTTSNYVTQYNNLFVLPLQWLSFTAIKQNSHVLLQWSTAQEQNTKDFIVQHSADGTSWANIGTVEAAGNSSSTSNYSYLHVAPVNGMNYYRILERDIDERSTYSIIRSLNINDQGQLIEVMRNPVKNGLVQIKVNASTSIPVSFYSGDGKLLWSKRLAGGLHNIDVSQYAKGVYFLKTDEVIEKLILQ